MSYYTEYINKRPDYEFVGVYGDEGISGTSLRNREQFKKLIEDCEAGKIDLVITKSISRFARNTQDCLHYSRMLKNMGIGIFFEKENISTMDAGGGLLFTILSSLAQEESRNISENCTWGIRNRFKNGESHQNGTIIFGYDNVHGGKMKINRAQASVVKRIYNLFLEGNTYAYIAHLLNEEGVPGNKGGPRWNASTIRRILINEKYKGDSLLQKTYTADYLTHKTVKNTGQVDQYYVKNTHPGIIDKTIWEAVQLEIERRAKFMKEHNLAGYGYSNGSCAAFISQVFCGKCGSKYGRQAWNNRNVIRYYCKDTVHRKGGNCSNRRIDEAAIKKAIVIAWNSIVQDRSKYIDKWQKMINESNPLEKVRGQQMIDLTDEGKIVSEVPELTRMVLEQIIVYDDTIIVKFLDGTEKQVKI